MGFSMLWYDREESSLIGEMQGNVLCECCFGLQVKVDRGTRQTKWPAAAAIAQASNRGVKCFQGTAAAIASKRTTTE